MQPIIDPTDISIWVHTCPQRAGRIHECIDALKRSDAGEVSVHCHEPGLQPRQLCDWWRERWIEEARRGARYVLRIEDDVEVATHLRWNLSTWRAMLAPDLGVGALFTMESVFNRGTGIEVTRDWQCRHRAKQFAGAQMFVMRSSDVPWCMDHLTEGFEAYMRDARKWPAAWELDFDCSMTAALRIAGKHTYVHLPSLGRSLPAAEHSAFYDFERQGEHVIDTASTWMGLDWRRETSDDDEIAVRYCLGQGKRAWAVLHSPKGERVVPVFALTELGAETVRVRFGGRDFTLNGRGVFGTQQQAEAYLGSHP